MNDGMGKEMPLMQLERTGKDDPRFLALVRQLDQDLSGRYEDGNDAYASFNGLEKITAVLLALEDGEPVGCAAFKPFSQEAVEIKRVYVKPEYRGQGISKLLMSGLERWAAEEGFLKAVLETGVGQPEAVSLYKKIGYSQIENFEPYTLMESSLCFEKHFR